MRQLYSNDFLERKSKQELNRLLDIEKRNDFNRSKQDQKENIENIEYCLNGGVSARDKQIVKDMMAGMADIDDIVGV